MGEACKSYVALEGAGCSQVCCASAGSWVWVVESCGWDTEQVFSSMARAPLGTLALASGQR